MSLLDRFRQPRWKHTDRDVRVSAVEALGDDEQDVLQAIAREDEDATVRRLATARLDDPAVLAGIHRSDSDLTVRDEARKLLVDLALDEDDQARAEAALAGLDDERDLMTVAKGTTFEVVGRAAMLRVSTERALGTVARHASHPAVRLAALERIVSPEERLAVAVKGEHKDVALAALGLIDDDAALELVATRARNKLVSRRARALLRERSGAAAPEQIEAPAPAAREEICDALERAAALTDVRLLATHLREADAQWATWDEQAPAGDPAIAERFQRAREGATAALEQARAAELEARAGEERRRQEAAAHLTVCANLDALAGDEIPDGIAAAEQSWAALDAAVVDEALEGRFRGALADAAQRHERHVAERSRREMLAAIAEAAEAATAQDQLSAANQQWAEALKRWNDATDASPAPDDLVARIRQAEARLAQRAVEAREAQVRERYTRLEQLVAQCDRFEALAARPELTLKDADQAWRDARHAAESIGMLPTRHDHVRIANRLKDVQSRLFGRLQEIRDAEDWKRWANAGVQEELCLKVEALAGVESVRDVARQLRDLRQRWKQVSAGPRSKDGDALWQRFRVAADAAQARCDAFFAERAVDEQQRLVNKLQLVERAETLAESTDWLRTAEELKALQHQWQAIGAVTSDEGRQLTARFRAACDRFFTRRKEDLTERKAVWGANQAKKEALCAEAERLAESSDWQDAFAAIKRLQVDWKTVGPVKRQKSEVLWKRFRGACDRFFERYQNRDQLRAQSARAERETLIAALDAVGQPTENGESAAPADTKTRLHDLWRQWSALAPAARDDQAALESRFEQSWVHLIERVPALSGTDVDPRETLRRMEALCQQVEGTAGTTPDPAKDPPAVALASMLKEALAANTIGGRVDEQAKRRAAADAVRAAQQAWRELGPAPGEQARELTARFQKACRRFFDRPGPRHAGPGGGRPPAPRRPAASEPAPQTAPAAPQDSSEGF
jgi:hypothetical protein